MKVTRVVLIVLVVAAVALSAAVYSRLPERMPTHWNADGVVNGYAPKAISAFLMPALMVVFAAMFAALPSISPAGFDIEEKSRAYRRIVAGILIFLFALHVYLILAALGIVHSINNIMPFLIGALYIILGNYLPKVRRNFFIGIRTPWTLADEDVWYRTHRLAGALFVISGVLLMIAGPFLRSGSGAFLLVSLAVGSALIAVVYSFVIYRRPKGEVSS